MALSTPDTSEVGSGAPPRIHQASDRVPVYVWLVTLGVAAQAFAGSWDLYSSPVPLDRVLLAAGVAGLLVHPDARSRRFRLRPLHLMIGAALGWCLASMLWFGTLTDKTALFALVDSFGFLPFVLLILAPVVFSTAARRDALAATMTWLGLYLGWVSVAEGLHLYDLVVPAGLVQPEHTHFERALGPSLQVASNGLALLGCLAFAAVHAAHHRGWRRLIAVTSAGLCLAGVFFTLTRSIWLAAVLGIVVVVIREPRLRGAALVGVVGVVLGLLAVFLLSPDVADAAEARAETSRSVYDRLNANEAALRILADRPFTGVGFQRFHTVEADWVRQATDYPITAVGIDVHNVLLGHAAELGLPGAALWLAVLVSAGTAAVAGPRQGGLRAYRLAAAGYAVAWVTVSMFVPIKYALPTTLLWLSLGIVADPGRLGWHRPAEEPCSARSTLLTREIPA